MYVTSWVLAIAIATFCAVGMIVTGSYEYFTMWSLTFQLKSALIVLAALARPRHDIVARIESIGTPTAFVLSVSVFVSTLIMSTDHESEKWFFGDANKEHMYAQYVVAHAVTPILFGALLWMSFECTHKALRLRKFVESVVLLMASATIPIEFWASFYNPELVYHTNMSPHILLVTFFIATCVTSILAVGCLGARPLYSFV